MKTCEGFTLLYYATLFNTMREATKAGNISDRFSNSVESVIEPNLPLVRWHPNPFERYIFCLESSVWPKGRQHEGTNHTQAGNYRLRVFSHRINICASSYEDCLRPQPTSNTHFELLPPRCLQLCAGSAETLSYYSGYKSYSVTR